MTPAANAATVDRRMLPPAIVDTLTDSLAPHLGIGSSFPAPATAGAEGLITGWRTNHRPRGRTVGLFAPANHPKPGDNYLSGPARQRQARSSRRISARMRSRMSGSSLRDPSAGTPGPNCPGRPPQPLYEPDAWLRQNYCGSEDLPCHGPHRLQLVQRAAAGVVTKVPRVFWRPAELPDCGLPPAGYLARCSCPSAGQLLGLAAIVREQIAVEPRTTPGSH